MLDDDNPSMSEPTPTEVTPVRRTRRRAASRPAGPPQPDPAPSDDGAAPNAGGVSTDVAQTLEAAPPPAEEAAPAEDAAPKKATRKSTAKPKTQSAADGTEPAAEKPKRKRSAKKAATAAPDEPATAPEGPFAAAVDAAQPTAQPAEPATAAAALPPVVLFKAPDPAQPVANSRQATTAEAPAAEQQGPSAGTQEQTDEQEQDRDSAGGSRRRRSRGGRNRRKSSGESDSAGPSEAGGATDQPAAAQADTTQPDKTDKSDKTEKVAKSAKTAKKKAKTEQSDEPIDTDESGGTSRRRRRRRRTGDGGDAVGDDPDNTVVKVRAPRAKQSEISGVEGSTRIEAKKQRRREGREAGRRRPPILSESEFLARRESVDREMVIRQRGEMTQIAVLEDGVLVEHYVALESQTSIIGNVYLGRVQNVLPSMEAAFIDIGKGRNGVLYAGEVNWSLMGGGNQARRIENALKPGQPVLVQASKDPVGHKGARLTSMITLPGRYLVSVPGGGTSGISRKLPDTERTRLKNLLKDILPDKAGVIVRTAAEGASEEELTRDVTRLTARWEDIEKKSAKGQAPQLLYAEPDTTLKVVRDLFTEDFKRLVISGDDAWDMVDAYVQHVAPDLGERLERYDGKDDAFAEYRIDEQIAKALERKVWLPSGGSLVIDRTEAMTVVDVNTGKFTGSGGNLEETVTKNNLEAAEEMVRQLRLRDIGGIIVIDFIDMVLEDNRDLVLRRLVECLGRDRTRHQVSEITSLGLVQMTRKRISTGLLEAFSQPCETCHGRGVVIEQEPIEPKKSEGGPRQGSGSDNGSGNASGDSKRSSGRRRGRTSDDDGVASTADSGDSSTDDGPVSVSSTDDGPVSVSSTDDGPVSVTAEADPPSPETPTPEPAETSTPTRSRRRRSASRPAGQPTPAGEPASA